jgi:nucleoside-diphosphate-sugar epimerase
MKGSKTIFLTGATGFVGAHLVYELGKRGCSFVLLIRPGRMSPEKKIENSLRPLCSDKEEWRRLRKNIDIIPGDLSGTGMSEAFRKVESFRGRIDEVIHNAAMTNFDSTWDELKSVNIDGTEQMLQFALRLKSVRFHYVSTAYVCGNYDGVFREDFLDRGQSFNNLYEKSKLEAEKLVSRYSQESGIQTVVYRPSIVVGDSITGRTSNFLGVYSFVKAIHLIRDIFCKDIAQGGERARSVGAVMDGDVLDIPLRIPVRPGKTLNIVPIDYVVSVMTKSVLEPPGSSVIFHITNPSPPSIEDLCGMLCRFFHVRGLRIVPPDELASMPLSSWENFFLSSLRGVSSYLVNSEPEFSDENTQRLLQNSKIRCPEISEEMIAVLAGFYLQSRKVH